MPDSPTIKSNQTPPNQNRQPCRRRRPATRFPAGLRPQSQPGEQAAKSKDQRPKKRPTPPGLASLRSPEAVVCASFASPPFPALHPNPKPQRTVSPRSACSWLAAVQPNGCCWFSERASASASSGGSSTYSSGRLHHQLRRRSSARRLPLDAFAVAAFISLSPCPLTPTRRGESPLRRCARLPRLYLDPPVSSCRLPYHPHCDCPVPRSTELPLTLITFQAHFVLCFVFCLALT